MESYMSEFMNSGAKISDMLSQSLTNDICWLD